MRIKKIIDTMLKHKLLTVVLVYAVLDLLNVMVIFRYALIALITFPISALIEWCFGGYFGIHIDLHSDAYNVGIYSFFIRILCFIAVWYMISLPMICFRKSKSEVGQTFFMFIELCVIVLALIAIFTMLWDMGYVN